jgi:hypothetical protein
MSIFPGALNEDFGTLEIGPIVAGAFTVAVVDVAVQSSGDILVMAMTSSTPLASGAPQDVGFAVLRFDENGTPDLSWGAGGVATNTGQPLLAVQQSGGEFVVITDPSHYSADIYRFDSQGVPDNAYGGDGSIHIEASYVVQWGATLPMGDSAFYYTEYNRYALDAADNLVVLVRDPGYAVGYDPTGLVRVLPDGVLDSSFGALGTATAPGLFGPGTNTSPGSCDGTFVATQPDGKLLVAGATVTSSHFLQCRSRTH